MAHLTIGPVEDKLKERLERTALLINRSVSWYVRVALDKQTAADLDIEPLGVHVVSVGMYSQRKEQHRIEAEANSIAVDTEKP